MSAITEAEVDEEVIECLAAWLCDEWREVNPCVGYAWPEHENDTGYRYGGYVKLQPSDVVAGCRDNARRILATIQGFRSLQRLSDPAAAAPHLVAPNWRPIAEAPRDGTQFLAALSNGWVMIISEVRGWDRYAWYRGTSGLSVPVARTHRPDGLKDCVLATHWMPLPAPPAALQPQGSAI